MVQKHNPWHLCTRQNTKTPALLPYAREYLQYVLVRVKKRASYFLIRDSTVSIPL